MNVRLFYFAVNSQIINSEKSAFASQKSCDATRGLATRCQFQRKRIFQTSAYLLPLFLVSRFRLGKRIIRGADKFCHKIALVNSVWDEMRLRAGIRKILRAPRIKIRAALSFFDKKAVVANQADDFVFAINSVVAEHFFV